MVTIYHTCQIWITRSFNLLCKPRLSSCGLAWIHGVFFMMMVGAAWPVLFQEGSDLGKNLETRELVEAVDDKGIEAAMAAALYGEKPDAVESNPHDPSAVVDFLRVADKVGAILCLALAAALPWLCRWKTACAWGYVVPALWLLANAVAAMDTGGKAHAELTIPAHATRWMLPLVMTLLIWRPSAVMAANWMLRIATAMTFATHGWEAFRLNPAFQDLIYSFGALFGVKVPSVVNHGLLHAIGLMDVWLALSVLLIHRPVLLRWMVFWGLVTALARPLTIGWLAWPELAVRLSNGFCPWLILAIGLPALVSFCKQTDQNRPMATKPTTPSSTDSSKPTAMIS